MVRPDLAGMTLRRWWARQRQPEVPDDTWYDDDEPGRGPVLDIEQVEEGIWAVRLCESTNGFQYQSVADPFADIRWLNVR